MSRRRMRRGAATGELPAPALATSVGVNLALTLLLAMAYTLLRHRPPTSWSTPRADPTRRGREPWRRSEEDIHAAAGLDGVVFLRIFVFSIRAFAAAAVPGIGVLLPVNFLGDQLRNIDFSDLSNKSIDLFRSPTSRTVPTSIRWECHTPSLFLSWGTVCSLPAVMWLADCGFTFLAVYILSGIVCYLLYHEYKYISGKSPLFYDLKAAASAFHCPRAIPVSEGVSVSDAVEKFFKEYHPSAYLSHTVVHQTGKLRVLLAHLFGTIGELVATPEEHTGNVPQIPRQDDKEVSVPLLDRSLGTLKQLPWRIVGRGRQPSRLTED